MRRILYQDAVVLFARGKNENLKADVSAISDMPGINAVKLLKKNLQAQQLTGEVNHLSC